VKLHVVVTTSVDSVSTPVDKGGTIARGSSAMSEVDREAAADVAVAWALMSDPVASASTAPPASAVPMHDDRWLTAFQEQVTPALRRRLESFTRYLIDQRGGGHRDAAFLRETVADVLTDTMLGKLSWDPSRNTRLSSHLMRAIRSRVRRECERAAMHISMEDLDEAQAAAVEDALAETAPSSSPAAARWSAQIVARLRELAVEDREVLSLLDAMCAGFLERARLMRHAGLSARAYKAARRRLGHLVAQLPQHAV
jgi:hypothetical protein